MIRTVLFLIVTLSAVAYFGFTLNVPMFFSFLGFSKKNWK